MNQISSIATEKQNRSMLLRKQASITDQLEDRKGNASTVFHFGKKRPRRHLIEIECKAETSSRVAFLLQQFSLAGNAPAITCEFAVAADDAMTRHGHRHRIARASPCDRSHGLRFADLLGDVTIAAL